MEPEVTPSLLKEITLGIAAIFAVVWSALRFIFEPRLNIAITEKATAIVDARVAPLTRSLRLMQEQLDLVEQEGVARGATMDTMNATLLHNNQLLERVVEKIERHGESLAYIEGTMRNRAPRTPLHTHHREDRDDGQ